MPTKTPKEVLGWLLRGRDDLKHADGEPNLHKLERVMQKELGRTVSQSTLHRIWTDTQKEMRQDTVEVLSAFFGVPESIIRGELNLPHIDSLGMDITLAEIQHLHRLRALPMEHRQLVDAQIRALQPKDEELPPASDNKHDSHHRMSSGRDRKHR
jgi:hypothetical protein